MIVVSYNRTISDSPTIFLKEIEKKKDKKEKKRKKFIGKAMRVHPVSNVKRTISESPDILLNDIDAKKEKKEKQKYSWYWKWFDDAQKSIEEERNKFKPKNRTYPKEFTKKRKRLLYNAREQEWCSHCWSKLLLQVHHMDKDINNNDDSNLVVLCFYCHWKYHNHLRKPPSWLK